MLQQVNQIVRDYEADSMGIGLEEFAQVWIRTNAQAYRQHYELEHGFNTGSYSSAEIIENLN
jgi:hypothetical protein